MRRLEAAGYREAPAEDIWELAPGEKRYSVRGGGSLVALRMGAASPVQGGFRVLGAHTDSPNLRLKPCADVSAHGYQQLAVEPYGGVLAHTWLDRDLSLAGQVTLREGDGTRTLLIDFARPLLRIPNLAIHLNREIASEGLKLNAQTHLAPVAGLEGAPALAELIAKELRARQLGSPSPADVLAFDLMLYDPQPAAVSGLRGEFIQAGRLDNLVSCHAAVTALLAAAAEPPPAHASVVVLYDHEEVGSRSAYGAAGPLLADALERATTGWKGGEPQGLRARARALAAGLGRHGPRRAPELRGSPRARPSAAARGRARDQAQREPVVCERRGGSGPDRVAVRAARDRAAILRHPQRPRLRLDHRPHHRGARRHPHGRHRQPDALDALLPRDGGQRRRAAHDRPAAALPLRRMSPPAADGDRAFIERAARIGIIAFVSAGVVLGLLWLLRAALTPLAVAFVIAYLFDPLIDRFEARGIGRRLAIFLLLGLVALVLLAFAFLVIPRLIAEIAALSASLPGYFERFLDRTVPRIEGLLGITLPHTLQEGLEHLRTGGLQIVLDTARSTLERTVSVVTGTALRAGRRAGGAGDRLLRARAVRRDQARDPAAWCRALPAAACAEKSAVVDRLVSGFIRGQLIVCLCLGFLYAVGFSAIGVDLAVGIGVAAGMLAIIPYVGSAFALGSASLLCVLEFGVDVHLALVAGWYVVVQTLEGFVLVPRIVGGSIGMHPVTVIVALLIGGDLLGFLGLIVAVPLAAVVQVFVRDGIAAYRRSPLYAGAGGEPEGGAPSALTRLSWRDGRARSDEKGRDRDRPAEATPGFRGARQHALRPPVLPARAADRLHALVRLRRLAERGLRSAVDRLQPLGLRRAAPALDLLHDPGRARDAARQVAFIPRAGCAPPP